MVDQVDVPGAIQGHEYFFDALGDALKKGAHRGRTRSPVCCARHHDGSGPEVLLLVDAQLLNFGTVKPDWHQRVVGRGNNVIPYLYRCAVRGERVKGHQRQGDPG